MLATLFEYIAKHGHHKFQNKEYSLKRSDKLAMDVPKYEYNQNGTWIADPDAVDAEKFTRRLKH